MNTQRFVLFVLSCDAYQDLWDDFFNLRDRYWKDCPYNWYLITETADYYRNNVEVIKCGKDLNWAGRLRHAINLVDSDFYGLLLEDFFICEPIKNNIINELIDIMSENDVTFLNTSDVFHSIIGMKEKSFFKDHLIIIPPHRRYGVSAQAAIWQRQYLLDKLGEGDYSAWQFEIDRVLEADSAEGLGGFNLCDDRMPFHVCRIPVVIQGKIYPPSRKFFKNQGYVFLTKRKNMSLKQCFLYRLKVKCSRSRFGKNSLKWLASKILGMKFFT